MKSKHRQNCTKSPAAYKAIINECLIDHLPINIFLVDTEGYVCWANDHLLETVEKNLDEVRGMHISYWHSARWEYVYEVVVNKAMTVHEETYGDDHYFTIRKPLFNDASEIIGILGISIEITESKKVEIAKEQFLNNIRHDIRTPLTGIIGLVEVLSDAIDDPELSVLLHSLMETSDSLLKILDHVFESITISSGESPNLQHHFSLKDTLETVYKLHQAKAHEKKLTLSFDYDKALPSVVFGAAMHVQRIVWELLTNALKYTEKGTISLTARLLKRLDEELTVEIRVKDTGIGIPLNKQEIIFKKFTRLTSSWTGGAIGQGLGLFNVKQLITDLGGTIYLKSAVDEGSLFICHITFKVAYHPIAEMSYR